MPLSGVRPPQPTTPRLVVQPTTAQALVQPSNTAAEPAGPIAVFRTDIDFLRVERDVLRAALPELDEATRHLLAPTYEALTSVWYWTKHMQLHPFKGGPVGGVQRFFARGFRVGHDDAIRDWNQRMSELSTRFPSLQGLTLKRGDAPGIMIEELIKRIDGTAQAINPTIRPAHENNPMVGLRPQDRLPPS